MKKFTAEIKTCLIKSSRWKNANFENSGSLNPLVDNIYLIEMLCTTWYHLYNLINVKNTHACNFTKINTPPWVFFTFQNCTNGTKSLKASQLMR